MCPVLSNMKMTIFIRNDLRDTTPFSIELSKRSIKYARFRLNSFQYCPIGQLFQLNSSRPRFRPIEFVIDSFNLVRVHVIGYFDF